MKIKFSRHAKRRARLYKIPESTILNLLESKIWNQGNHEITKIVAGIKYPLKIVFIVEGDMLTVITSYPLKKGAKGEGIL